MVEQQERAIATSRYWDGTGTHQALYDQVKGLVPREGEADEETLETLRLVSRCYYDTYNNGGCNGFLFADALGCIQQSDLNDNDKDALSRLFRAACGQVLEIQFDGRPDPADEDDIDPEDEDALGWIRRRVLVKESEFSQPLERLADWATKRARLKHCA